MGVVEKGGMESDRWVSATIKEITSPELGKGHYTAVKEIKEGQFTYPKIDGPSARIRNVGNGFQPL